MVKTIRTFFLSLMILAFLLFNTVGTTRVYADDGRQPDPTGTGQTDSSGEGQSPTDTTSQGTQTSSVGRTTEEETLVEIQQETASSDEEETPVEVQQETASSGEGEDTSAQSIVQITPLALETILERVPDDTTITVLDSEGQTLTLASQESAYAIGSAVDPIWCPANQPPTPGMNGCTESFSTFEGLLAFLDENEDDFLMAGTIYIQKNEYIAGENESSIDFNNYDFDSLMDYNLTLQGGWDISTSIVNLADSTSFDIPIIIGSITNLWGGSLTINNINISNVYDQTGLTLFSENNITLSNVEVTDSQSGAELKAGGTVTVTDSKFDDNGSSTTDGYGLMINSGANVTLEQVSASGNEKFGADITADGAVKIDNGVFSGNVSYAYHCHPDTANGGYGLSVVSASNVEASEIHADDNYFYGAYLEGADVEIYSGTFNNNGSGSIKDPVGSGLQVNSSGEVVLDSLQANSNQLFGANVQAVGDVRVSDSFFNGNQGVHHYFIWEFEGYGLNVITDGDIELDAVTANDNFVFGAHLKGADVKISNSIFSNNNSGVEEKFTAYGLEVISTGKVTLSNVTANDNQSFGANIQATDAVKVTNSFFNGNQSYTYTCQGKILFDGYGIQIVTDREVSLINVEATDNFLFGAHIEAKDVAIDTANFSNNGTGWGLALTGRGLEIDSENEVSLAGVTADNNQLFGADITANGLVAIERSSFDGHISYVYFYGTDEIESRYGGYGLRVVTDGDIALEAVTADNNYQYGAYLEGDDTAVEGGFDDEGVFISSSFSGNGTGVMTEPHAHGSGYGYGLQIVSTGEAELYDVNANNNQLFGADISAVQDVTVVRSFFSGNQSVTITPCQVIFDGYGLNVVTDGDISLDLVTANRNNLWGASLTGNNVWVSNSQFNNNISDSTLFIDDTGLLVNAGGFVDLYKVEAKENRLIGADITAAGNVYVAESNFSDNRGYTCIYDWCPEGGIVYHGYGLQVTTPGLISVVDTIAGNNNLFGAQLNGGVVIVEDSTFNNNGMGNGLTINASDNVTLTNVTAMNNGGNGVEVNGVCEKIVQVNGGTFSDNLLYGLKVIDAVLGLDNTQVFANNGSGNIFTDTSICIVVNP